MKSNKQRRQEIKARRRQQAERQACRVNARPVDRPIGTVTVTPTRLRPTTSYGEPDFVRRGYYQDRPFRCKDCGVDEVWAAAQQRWWYEEAQGDVWTMAVRCRACRLRERERKAEARRVHWAGLTAKSRGRELWRLFKRKLLTKLKRCERSSASTSNSWASI